MGSSRETREQQHRFLLELAARFQNVTSLALKAHYGGDSLFDKLPILKLATMVVSRNELFSRDIATRGHAIRFGSQTNAGDSEDEDLENKEADTEQQEEVENYYEDPDFKFDDKAPLLLATSKPGTANRYTPDQDGLEDLLQSTSQAAKPKTKNIIKWLEDMYKGSRGFELGTFDASIIPIIWRKQSANWEEIALGYISDVVSLVHSFIVSLLRACCSSDRVLEGLLSVLTDHMTARYKNAIDHTKFLLLVERAGTPLTANHYFADNLEKW